MTRSTSVILIEDDDDDYILTKDLLESVSGTDYELTWCSSLDTARELLGGAATPHFDACLVDYRLGSSDGLEVLRYFASHELDIPCIMLTGRADAAADRAAMALGAADYLVKGRFDAETLERSVRHAIDNAAVVRRLRDSEARFRSVIGSATDGIVLMDNNSVVLASNSAANELVGLPDTNVVGRSCLEFLTPESINDLVRVVELDAATGGLANDTGQEIDATPLDAHFIHDAGHLVPVRLSITSWVSGGQRFWSVAIRDLSETRALSDRLEFQALHDPLTGLGNRSLLKDKIANRLRAVGYADGIPALIFIDLDNFKLVNDTFGHEVGDELLIIVAARLVGCVRQSDVVARLGGDEFAVFLHSCRSSKEPEAVAQRLVDVLAEPVILGGLPVVPCGSVGVALAHSPSMSTEELIRDADVAMYSAKTAGKNRMAVFDPSMNTSSFERIRIENDLRLALTAGQIGVAYQPVVRLDTGRTHGFEALARWTDLERGDVPPAVFVAVAEDAGLIEELGRAVLERAVTETADIQRQLGCAYQVNVNLSTWQLADKNLVSSCRALLTESGLAHGTLTLEVTESVMVGHVDRAIAVLNELRDLDVRLALDDFGTGYSSLSYLHLLPLDALKADRSFVIRHDEPGGEALLRAIVAIGSSLGLRTVAEGIEDEAELASVRRLGYDLGQGYLFSKPVTLGDLTELLEAENAHN